MPARSIRITGRVQGVGFRWWTRGQAQQLGLVGTVRNLPDGSVGVLAQGTEESLDRLVDALKRGPPDASVASVEQTSIDESPRLGFDITH